MSKLKAGILEDNKLLLKELKMNLEETGLVSVVVFGHDANDFVEKVRASDVDALVLDIDLIGDSMSGLDVASLLNKPVLFASGKTRDYINEIEHHNLNSDTPVEHVTKPVTLDKLRLILPKFIQRIEYHRRNTSISLDFSGAKNQLIQLDDIVFVETLEGSGGKSGNKRIHFVNRKPEILIDKSFNELEALGLSKQRFIKPHRSFRVNPDKILHRDDSKSVLLLKAFDGMKPVEHHVPISRNY